LRLALAESIRIDTLPAKAVDHQSSARNYFSCAVDRINCANQNQGLRAIALGKTIDGFEFIADLAKYRI